MKKKVIKISIIILAILFCMVNISYGSDSTSTYGSNTTPISTLGIRGQLYGGDNSLVTGAASYIAGVLEYAALIVAVIVLMFKGIKFLTAASPDVKADAQKELIPWAIGVVLLFSLITFLNSVVVPIASNFTGK